MPAKDPVLVSAHRCGAGDDVAGQNGLHALEHSLALGVDYIEFDVRRLPDGRRVVSHDVPGEGLDLIEYDAVLTALDGRAGAHIDLKTEGCELEVVRRALEVLPADRIVATTGSEAGCRALVEFARAEGLPLRVGLSLGPNVKGLTPWRAILFLRRQLFPTARLAASGANVVCAQHWLAALTLRRFARRRGLDLLVWTVDSPTELRWWLRPGRAWMVTTNHPDRALSFEHRRRRRDLARP